MTGGGIAAGTVEIHHPVPSFSPLLHLPHSSRTSHRCFRYNKPCRPATVTQGSRRPVRGTSSSSLLFQSSPYLDLVIERSDLPAMVPLYLQAFQDLFQEGVLNRKRAIGLLKSWVDLGVMMDGDCDPTFGAFAEVSRGHRRRCMVRA